MSIPKLIRMANGERRSLWRRYNYKDQLLGIEALGETKHPDALSFLKSLSAGQTQRGSRDVTMHGQGSGDCNPYNVSIAVEYVTFPMARGELRKNLEYHIDLETQGGGEYFEERSLKEIESNHLRAQERHAYKVLKQAINKLETTLNA